MNKVIIYGIGDFAKLMHYYFTVDSTYDVVAFCADKKYITKNFFCDLPIIPFESIDNYYSPDEYMIFIAVGYSNMRSRVSLYEKVKLKKYKSPNYISSKALVSNNVDIGDNNVFMADVVVEPFVKVGSNNIFWSSSTICHDVNIASHSFIAAQTLIGGGVLVGDNCFIGFNATILQHLKLANETLVGAKSLIKNDTKQFTKYIGIPAKSMGKHESTGIKI